VFALLNIAMADAAICSWAAKYTFNFLATGYRDCLRRPQLNWMSFMVTPPFPDYTSGHSTFSAAAAKPCFHCFYGTEDLPFTTGSDFLPGVFRAFQRASMRRKRSVSEQNIRRDSLRTAAKMGCKRGSSNRRMDRCQLFAGPKHNRSRPLTACY